MRFRNLQFSTPETDQKVMLVVSSLFMLTIWLAVASFLIFLWLQEQPADVRAPKDWNNADGFKMTIVGILALVLVVIPIQLARYYRAWRKL